MEEIVKYHSRVKHKFIEIYLNIWTERVANNLNGKKKSEPPSLEIYDLYAASGWCYCPDCEKYGGDQDRWEGSAILAAKCIAKYPKGKKLFLNSYHPDPVEKEENFITLEKSLKSLEEWPILKNKTYLVSEPIEKVLDIAEHHKGGVNMDYPTIWLLDPYEPKQLPWSIIERIGNMRGNYKIKGKERRPELIINFMSSYLQRFSDIQPDMLSEAIGLSEDEWKPKLDVYISDSETKLEALIKLFSERLLEIYDKPPVVYMVKDTSQRVVVYCMILCTNHDAGYFSMVVNEVQKLNEWYLYKWSPEAKMLVKRKKYGKDQKSILDSY